MALERWEDNPNTYDVISSRIFFDELKTNLKNVIRDYAELGVNDEPEMIKQTDSLFLSEIVPTRKDWTILEGLLDKLLRIKEFHTIWTKLYGEAIEILQVEDLVKIRKFLDIIQQTGPQLGSISVVFPTPKVTRLTRPIVSRNGRSFNISWDIDSNTLGNVTGTINGAKSPNEDMQSYVLNVEAGTFKSSDRFEKNANSITKILELDWWGWFGKNSKKAYLNIVEQATDKRGNVSETNFNFSYPPTVKMQAPIKSYQLQVSVNSGTWRDIYNGANKSFSWDNASEATGNYKFRVRGWDELDQETDWVDSDGLYAQYRDYTIYAPKVSGSPSYYNIVATWTRVDNADEYEVWIGGEQEAKSKHTNSVTRWKRLSSNETRSINFNGLNSGTNYTIYVRAKNERYSAVGSTNVRTLVPQPAPKPIPRTPQTKTYYPTGNQVWNGGYHTLVNHNTKGGGYTGAHWHNGGKGDSTGCYQGEWVDGLWTGDQGGQKINWKKKARGGWAYYAFDGQHWGNRMSFVHYNYNQIKNDIRGKTVTKVVITGTRNATWHGYSKASPLYLYNHKRDYTASTGTGGSIASSGGGKIHTVKSGEWLSKIASAYGITTAQLKSWNGISGDLIHPGQKLKVSAGGGSSSGGTSSGDNALVLYRADTKAQVGSGNQRSIYEFGINQGASFSFSNETTKQLVNNIANGDMKGIGMGKWYGSGFSSEAGFYTQDPAYMSFTKGSFALQVTYQ